MFDHVAVLAPRPVLAGESSGNIVLVASDSPLDPERSGPRLPTRQGTERLLVGEDLTRFADGASPLTDQRAPVDQWLARARTARATMRREPVRT